MREKQAKACGSNHLFGKSYILDLSLQHLDCVRKTVGLHEGARMPSHACGLDGVHDSCASLRSPARQNAGARAAVQHRLSGEVLRGVLEYRLVVARHPRLVFEHQTLVREEGIWVEVVAIVLERHPAMRLRSIR